MNAMIEIMLLHHLTLHMKLRTHKDREILLTCM